MGFGQSECYRMTVRERIAEWLVGPEQTADKAAIGIGATSLTYKPLLSSIAKDPRRAMQQAQRIGLDNLYIRACERVIGDRFSTVPWHLEDPSGELIESSPVLDLLRRPYTPLPDDPATATPRTRASLWRVTSRHIGLCGSSFWYMDEADALAGFPRQLLYIDPARMSPVETKSGALTGWVLDADYAGHGVPLERDRVLHFMLESADHGHYGIGLVESAYARAEMMRLAGHHAQEVLASGGRLAGVFSPPAASGPIPDDQFDQLSKDLRTVVERPDAARRNLILRGPIEFDRTTASPSELDLEAISLLGRDGILDLWGVPLSQLGGRTAGGLNSGDANKWDAAAMWQNAVGPRLRSFAEVLQYELLDRLPESDATLVIDEPQFEDKVPQFDMAAKARELPLTNAERRDIIGMEPLGIPDIDDAIWVPVTISHMTEAPQVKAKRVVPGEDRVRQKVTATMRKDVRKVLDDMAAEVGAKVTKHAAHLAKKPHDDAVWWDEAKWAKRLAAVLEPSAALAAEATFDKTEAMFVGKAEEVEPEAVKPKKRESIWARIKRTIGDSILGITDATRDKVRATIETGIEDGLGAAELGKLVERSAAFEPYRAEVIARTESNRALNTSQLETFKEFDIELVECIDGDEDQECIDRQALDNGWGPGIYTVEDAATIQDHPNGTLDWAPLTLTQEPR